MTSRADYKAAVALKNHLSRQSEDYQEPLPHHSIKTEDEKDAQFHKHIVKDLDLVRKLGGHFG